MASNRLERNRKRQTKNKANKIRYLYEAFSKSLDQLCNYPNFQLIGRREDKLFHRRQRIGDILEKGIRQKKSQGLKTKAS
ncbi:hypothetical protein QK911_02925 [Lactococcus lactis]